MTLSNKHDFFSVIDPLDFPCGKNIKDDYDLPCTNQGADLYE